MRIHHLELGAMHPMGGGALDGLTPGLGHADLVCHCLLIETETGPVLIDTGVAGADHARTQARIDPLFRLLIQPTLDPECSATHQLRRRGIQPGDVRAIVMTHMDFDHAGGLADFPSATVHVSAVEAAAVAAPRSLKERSRYSTARPLDRSGWRTYDTFSADFFGLQATLLDGLPGFQLVWLPGHTRGHCGVAVDLGRGQFLLHAGDAILNARELDLEHPFMPTGARLFQWSMQTSQMQRRRSLAGLRRVRRNGGDHVEILCTHDPALLARSEMSSSQIPNRIVYGGG